LLQAAAALENADSQILALFWFLDLHCWVILGGHAGVAQEIFEVIHPDLIDVFRVELVFNKLLRNFYGKGGGHTLPKVSIVVFW
jgi:hypothetical protein